jgi:hypothetical protein
MSLTNPEPNSSRDPWEIAETAFPRQRSKSEKLHFCVNYAALAPSSHNSQPWLFHVLPDQIEVYADLRRALPAVDPDFRELVISCGAALHNLVLALRYFGYDSAVEVHAMEIVPAENDHKVLLARVHIGSATVASAKECGLFHMIPKRRTSRMQFERRDIANSFLAEIGEIASSHGIWLQLLQEKRMREALADFVAQANRVQIADKKFRDELSSWSSSTRKGRRDGMPGYATGASFVLTYAGHFLFRTFRFPDWQARRDRNLVIEAPALAVLGTHEDSLKHWLNTGQALQAISLRACLDSIWISFLNQPIEVAALRAYLNQELGVHGHSQLLIRMGYGPVSGHTPRRPLEEILI